MLLTTLLLALAQEPLRLMIPSHPLRPQWTEQMQAWQKAVGQGGIPIQLLSRGTELSTLNDLMVSAVSKELADVAVIEWGEALTPELVRLVPPLTAGQLLEVEPLVAPQARSWLKLQKRAVPWIGYRYTAVVDQEVLFRHRLPLEPKLNTWPHVLALAERLLPKVEPSRARLPDYSPVCLSLQGPRGALLLEALDLLPHEAESGSMAASTVPPVPRALVSLRRAIERGVARGSMGLEQSLLQFAERRCSILIIPGDVLPRLAADIYFRTWEQPLGGVGFGLALVTTRRHPQSFEVLKRLMSPALRSSLMGDTAVGMTAPGPISAQRLRARAEWERVLPELFGDAQQRQPLEVVWEAVIGRVARLASPGR